MIQNTSGKSEKHFVIGPSRDAGSTAVGDPALSKVDRLVFADSVGDTQNLPKTQIIFRLGFRVLTQQKISAAAQFAPHEHILNPDDDAVRGFLDAVVRKSIGQLGNEARSPETVLEGSVDDMGLRHRKRQQTVQ